MTSSASSGDEGLVAASARPAWAWIAMAETWWATVSCSSRASRTRSSDFACSSLRSRALSCERTAQPRAKAAIRTATPPIASPTPGQLTNSDRVAGTRMIARPVTASRPDPQRKSA